jgi:RHS repeat-associated protein
MFARALSVGAAVPRGDGSASVWGPSGVDPDKADWYGSLIWDQQDATGYQYKRNRYYEPGTGRFTQEDPIGLAGGLNLYGFASGDPVNFSDPFGLLPCWIVDPSSCKNPRFFVAIAAFFKEGAAGLASAWDPNSARPPEFGGTGWLLGKTFMALGARAPVGRVVTDAGSLVGMSGMLRDAAKGTGDFGIGTATPEAAEQLGRAWVGRGATEFGGGKGLRSVDGTRIYRRAVLKSYGEEVANLETMGPGGKGTIRNAHIQIVRSVF